ncbi:hypothetical protein STW0522RAO56_35840 [Raoultella planticola]|nr:hypothetical protein STW0522RAO56_35840 [Raoultella planticola]
MLLRWCSAYRGYRVWSPGSGASRDPGCSLVAQRLPGLRGAVVARVSVSRDPGCSPGCAELTGATGCGRPGQAQAATRGVPWWRSAYRGYGVWSPGSGASRHPGCSPVALRLPGLRGVVARVSVSRDPGGSPGSAALTGATRYVVARVRRKPPPGMLLRLRSAYRGYRVLWSPGSGASRDPGCSSGGAALTGATGCVARVRRKPPPGEDWREKVR